MALRKASCTIRVLQCAFEALCGTFAPGVLSSVGRAPPLHGDGREFDPLSTHQSSKSGTLKKLLDRLKKFCIIRFSADATALKDGVVVQLVRIPACHAGGRGFESRPLRQQILKKGEPCGSPFFCSKKTSGTRPACRPLWRRSSKTTRKRSCFRHFAITSAG